MYCHSPVTLRVVIFPNLRFHNSNDDQDKKLALHKEKTAVLPAKELEVIFELLWVPVNLVLNYFVSLSTYKLSSDLILTTLVLK